MLGSGSNYRGRENHDFRWIQSDYLSNSGVISGGVCKAVEQIRCIIIKKAPFIRKPPPCLSRIWNKGGGFLIKSAGGRKFFQDSVSFCCENPFSNVVFFCNGNVMLQIQIHQNFRLRLAVRNTLLCDWYTHLFV